ncbi:hypothetical protein [Phenylobacterium sp.]|jgi:hypothetical protein|uniref:hypothetical protein n=1 Tax=Phenylobacterium sp. TaxID=1871053 RepID=UPI000C991C20|nr:hypothetical protein [Phenylobacterium sp.]MAK83154.1 hypothetical protein [Phenylobacterium sp.]|tara:strand:+ start:9232 stop:9978 length:747 start_codon:yes stop_codon:yes gene_type:complete
MALVDDPREMILRMFYLQAKEGFPEDCLSFPEGAKSPVAEQGDPVFAAFRQKHFFSREGVGSKTRAAQAFIRWADLQSSKVAYRGRKDILVVASDCGLPMEIDLSSPTGGRPALRIVQLVEGLGKRWSTALVTGHGFASIDEFFSAAKRDNDFAVNLTPNPGLERFRHCFDTLAARPDVDDVKIILTDPEDEGEVYAEAIVVVSKSPPDLWIGTLLETGAGRASPADANVRRQLKLPDTATALVITWP